jgi:hypothetical protein
MRSRAGPARPEIGEAGPRAGARSTTPGFRRGWIKPTWRPSAGWSAGGFAAGPMPRCRPLRPWSRLPGRADAAANLRASVVSDIEGGNV